MKKISIKRFIPILILLVLCLLAWLGNLQHYLTFENLKSNHAFLETYVQAHLVLAVLIFIAMYATIVALSIPGATIMTMAGGLFFGAIGGTCVNVISATIGAIIVFIITKRIRPDFSNMKSWIKKMETGFKKDSFNYLLVLRLIPLFPFAMVNLIPALLGMPLGSFTLATIIGIIPGSFVYTSVGAGLGSIFQSGQEFSAKGIFTPEILMALIGLALLSLVPVIYKRFKGL